jgi:hypothetical protein
MKPDHRHELKTNELAEWLSSLPQWVRENNIYVIFISAVIIAAAFLYFWRTHSEKAALQKQLEFTSLAGQLLVSKVQILQSQEQGKDLSFMLLQTGETLGVIADNTDDDRIAALALIKQAEAQRTELHYRLQPASEQEAVAQISRAKANYAKALERYQNSPSLTAAAKLGLGLCEEELYNFESAEQIYRDIATNPDFEGTVAAAQAKIRLETMDDYKQKIAFKSAPKMPALEFTEPADANTFDINLGPASPNAASEAPVIEVNNINQPGQ